MRVAVRIPPCRPLPELAATARRAEVAGFDTASFPDSPTLYRDTISALSFAAMATETITVATSVTHFVTRDPIVLASGARTAAELAPGRLRLSIGAGDSSAFLTARRPSKTSEMRDGIAIIRSLLAGEPTEVRGAEVVLQDPSGPIPIYLAAEGPKNLALAAEIADGAITWPGELERKSAYIAECARRVGRTRPLARVATVTVQVTDDVASAAHRLKPYVLRYAQRTSPEVLEQIGFAGTFPEGNVVLPDGSDLGHPRDLEAAAAFASQWVSDEFAIWYATNVCWFGSGPEVASRIAGLAGHGIDEVQVTDGGAFNTPDTLIERMGDEVIPLLRLLPTR